MNNARKRLKIAARRLPAFPAAIVVISAGTALGAFLGVPATPQPIVQVVRVVPPIPWQALPPLDFHKPVAHIPETSGGAWLAISASEYFADTNPPRRKWAKLSPDKRGGKREKKDRD